MRMTQAHQCLLMLLACCPISTGSVSFANSLLEPSIFLTVRAVLSPWCAGIVAFASLSRTLISVVQTCRRYPVMKREVVRHLCLVQRFFSMQGLRLDRLPEYMMGYALTTSWLAWMVV